MPTPKAKPAATPDFIPAETPDFIPAEDSAAPQQTMAAPAQPGNAFTSGNFLDTVKANYQDAIRPTSDSDGGFIGKLGHSIGRATTNALVTPFVNLANSHPIDDANQDWENAKQHPFKAAASMALAPANMALHLLPETTFAEGLMSHKPLRENLEDTASTALGNLAAEGTGEAIAGAGKGLRTAAIGNPDAAALRGFRVPPMSDDVLPTQQAIQTARPYFQGTKSLEDFQSRFPGAKDEIWSPYQQTIEAVGDHPIKGPDGMTTVRALEDERQQISANLRKLKQGGPEAIQLATQKGMNQADLLAREKAVQGALDPYLSKFGIDPTGIRGTYGGVAQLGERMSGMSTLTEPTKPSGFGRMLNIKMTEPRTYLGEPLQGVRDIAAGRPWWAAKPTDVGMREGFRPSAPKPDLGNFTPFKPTGLLGQPPIELGASPEVGGVPEGYRPPPFYHDTTPMRTGRLLDAPPIELGGRVQGTPEPMFRHDTTPMRMGRTLPAPRAQVPMSSYSDIFPDQLPASDTQIPASRSMFRMTEPEIIKPLKNRR